MKTSLKRLAALSLLAAAAATPCAAHAADAPPAPANKWVTDAGFCASR